TDKTLILDNVPRLADVNLLQRILGNHGVDIMVNGKRPGETQYDGQTLHISAANIIDTTAPYEFVSRMRASFWVVAPLVARMGEARISMPGGCAIGTRPVDLLIMALERLGARIDIDGGYVVARAPGGLKGGEIVFPKVTGGGTHTALMAAVRSCCRPRSTFSAWPRSRFRPPIRAFASRATAPASARWRLRPNRSPASRPTFRPS